MHAIQLPINFHESSRQPRGRIYEKFVGTCEFQRKNCDRIEKKEKRKKYLSLVSNFDSNIYFFSNRWVQEYFGFFLNKTLDWILCSFFFYRCFINFIQSLSKIRTCFVNHDIGKEILIFLKKTILTS